MEGRQGPTPPRRVVVGCSLGEPSRFQSRFESERSVLTLNSKSKKVWFLEGLWVGGEVAVRRAIHLSMVPLLFAFGLVRQPFSIG